MQLHAYRYALAAIAIVGALTSASAQSTRYYDSRGSSLGTSTTIGNTTTFYDARGSKTGTETRTGNTTTVYDSQGRNVGSATSMPRH